jgi:hypothetical protein
MKPQETRLIPLEPEQGQTRGEGAVLQTKDTYQVMRVKWLCLS